MKKFRTLLTIACMAFVMMVTGVKARAELTGTGTSTNPYWIYKFDELFSAVEASKGKSDVYITLKGNVTYEEDDSRLIHVYEGQTVHLELNGCTMKRKTKMAVAALFNIHGDGTLIIDDFEGFGGIETNFVSYSSESNGYQNVPMFKFDGDASHMSNLIINGGYFKNGYAIIKSPSLCGNVTINGGSFNREIHIEDNTTYPAKLVVNGGDFFRIDFICTSAENLPVSIRDCTSEYGVSVYCYTDTYNKIGLLGKAIGSSSSVYVNGTLTSYNKYFNKSDLTGNVKITDSLKPRFTSNPEDYYPDNSMSNYTFPYVGASHTFRAFAENAESYAWYVRDPNGNEYSWMELASKGIIQAAGGCVYDNVLTLEEANNTDGGLILYCVIYGNGYAVRSKPVWFQTRPVIKEICVEIENFEDAVVGANIGDFTKVKPDYLSHATASDATWYSYYEPAEGKIEQNESYVISFSVDLDEGWDKYSDDDDFKFDSKARCIVKTPKGDVVATKLAGSDETHANYEFTYEPPMPENGIKIKTVSRSIKEPAAGEAPAEALDPLSGAEALECPYVVQSLTWDPFPATFAEGEFSVLTIVYKAKEGYGFYDDTAFLINGEEMLVNEIVKGSGGTATVDYFFEVRSSIAVLDMHRLYNPNTGEHFYTASIEERDTLTPLGWQYEGIAWRAPEFSYTPVYRLFNPNSGEHHYTTSADERDNLTSLGWNFEGIGWYSDDKQGVPLHRLYNPNAVGQYEAGAHHYTPSIEERDNLINIGWRYEGVGWYGVAE